MTDEDYQRGRVDERADIARRCANLHDLMVTMRKELEAGALLHVVAELQLDHHVGSVADYDEANGSGSSARNIEEKTEDIVVEWERPYRYEVDVGMLPEGAEPAQLDQFCQVLQRIMDDEDTDLAVVVACERADNEEAPGRQMAWGWPTEENWQQAIHEVFGTIEVTP